MMSENGWNVDLRMLYTCIRAGEGEHAHTSHFLDVLKREYIEENNLVRGHAKNSDFPNVHQSTFYDTRSDAEKMGIPSVFTRFRRILSAWVVTPSIYALSIETARTFYSTVRYFSKKRKNLITNLILRTFIHGTFTSKNTSF